MELAKRYLYTSVIFSNIERVLSATENIISFKANELIIEKSIFISICFVICC